MDQSKKKRVLFIGDSSAFSGVSRRGDSLARWEPAFAQSREQAMSCLARDDFHAVVTDEKVGAHKAEVLLREISDKFPHLARLAMTARPNQKPTPSPIAAVQFIPRSSGAERIEASLERSAAVHQIVSGDKVRSVVGKVESLPTLPKTYRELLSLTNREDVSAALVAKALQQDPALCLKVLQVVNSVTFGLRQRISSIQQAVSYLGLELIKGIVLTAEVFQTAERAEVSGFSLERFQDYSIRIGRLASEFAKPHGLAEEAFTAGLLHDVGKLVLSMKQSDQFTDALLRMAETGEDAEVVEREVLGVSHSDAGAYLLWSWGIPYPVVECVAFHHATALAHDGPCELVASVHAAEALYSVYACGEPESRLDLSLLERAGMGGELEGWRRVVQESLA